MSPGTVAAWLGVILLGIVVVAAIKGMFFDGPRRKR